MGKDMTRKGSIRIMAAGCLGLMAAVILYLYLDLPMDADGPYPYTVRKIFFWSFWPLAIVSILLGPGSYLWALFRRLLRMGSWWGALAAASFAAIAAIRLCFPGETIPQPQIDWLAWAWICAYFSLAMYLYALAVKLNNWMSSPLCMFALLASLLGGMEVYFSIFPPQWHPLESYLDNSTSKYVLADEADMSLPMVERPYGHFPAKPRHHTASAAQHQMQRGETRFDVRYTMDDNGHRITPPANDKPDADLLLFGCSFTFGYALENEETWAWRLSELLGPRWLVTNYAYSGFGAQQMLTMLEEKAIQPPKAPIREAVFLAIRHHLHRFSGLFPVSVKSVRYDLRDGQLIRDGFSTENPYFFLSRILPETFFKGSMAIRKVSLWLSENILVMETGRLLKVYLAILQQSGKLLREEYRTNLTVLLWPDLEELAPELEKSGIKTVFARNFLSVTTANPYDSYVDKKLDLHPGRHTAAEIADGLYAYFREKDPALFEKEAEIKK